MMEEWMHGTDNFRKNLQYQFMSKLLVQCLIFKSEHGTACNE